MVTPSGYAMGGRFEASDDVGAMYKDIVSTMANIPNKASILFYAGLLEYHGAKGDGSVKSISDAQDILTDYLEENQDAEGNWVKSFSDVLTEMMEIMYEDNFFDLIGLNKMVSQTTGKKRTRKKSKAGENTSTE